jgi:CelD/BcsL family acetyltransferase involved in cellulose biosynthesis
MVAERGREGEVARAFIRGLSDGSFGEWDELVLERMSGEAPSTVALTHELRRAGFAVDERAHGDACYVPLPGTWEEYLKALSSSRRYRLRRALKDFTVWAGEEPRLSRVNDLSELSNGISILADLHAQRWRAEGKAGAFSSPPFLEFHERVMPGLLEDGALDLCWLCGHGQPLAALYNIKWRGRVHFYQSGRRVDLPERIRPGTVIHALAIRDAIERGLREYDFLAGSSRYKEELSLATRGLIALRITRNGLLREGARLLAQRGMRQARSLVQALRQRIGQA